MMRKDRKELVWVILVSTLILIWGSIPTRTGYKAETQDLRFRGLYFDSQDYAVHISMMEAGKHGDTSYRLRFTTESHNPAYLRMFYITLGHASRIFNISTEIMFQITRWVLGYLALFSLYKLIRRIFPDIFWARTAFLLAILGSGLGWLQLILNWTPGLITPIDFWLIDSYVFFSLSLFPHFAFVTIGMCIILSFWFDFLDTHRWQFIVWIGITSVLVQFVNPIALATIDVGLAGAMLATWWSNQKVRWSDLPALGTLAIAQMPLLLYNIAILNNDPIWSHFTSQNKTLSPQPSYYLLGFAPFIPFAIIGAISFFRSKSKSTAASLAWIFSGFALAYAPLFIQRRFLQNITIPLAILAVQGLMLLFKTETAQSPRMRRWKLILVFLFVFIASISSIQLSLGRALYLQTHPPELYYPSSLDDAVSWFRENAQYNDFALASEETSQVLAQKAGLRVYLGHEMETLDYEEKQELVRLFFLGELNNLAKTPIKWVIYGPYENNINTDFQPAANLQLVYQDVDLKIFRVK